MKKISTSFAFVLALILVMNNCKQQDADPLVPNQALVEDLNKIDVEKVALVKAEPVATTDSKIEISAKAISLAADISGINTTGVVPASVKTSAEEITSTITPAEITTLGTIAPETIAAMAAGGTLPANLQAILSKAAANSGLVSYIPKITLPTVAGTEIKGARIGGLQSIEKAESTLTNDACLTSAEDACESVRTKIKASRVSQLASVTAAYDLEVSPLAATEATRTAALTPKYLTLRTQAQSDADKLKLQLDANKTLLGNRYSELKALMALQLLGYFNSLNVLQEADRKACIAKTIAATNNAQNARNKNTEIIEAAIAKALAAVEKAKSAIAQSCHNQGGGK